MKMTFFDTIKKRSGIVEIHVIQGDITQIACDAIVNAANNSLLGGGGVDGAIHRVAGPELLVECRALHGCASGDAKVTKGYRLPARYVIHTVGPVYRDGNHHEAQILKSCYEKCLDLAEAYQCQHIAFPSISTGAYRYPVSQAATIAMETIQNYQCQFVKRVDIVCFDDYTYRVYCQLLKKNNKGAYD